MISAIKYGKKPSAHQMGLSSYASIHVDQNIEKAVKEKIKDMKGGKKELEPWEPMGSVKKTIESLSIFIDFEKEDGEKMNKKEIRESFDNLDTWIDDMAINYQAEMREQENKSFK